MWVTSGFSAGFAVSFALLTTLDEHQHAESRCKVPIIQTLALSLEAMLQDGLNRWAKEWPTLTVDGASNAGRNAGPGV